MKKSYELMIKQTGDDIIQKVNHEYNDKVYHQFQLPFNKTSMENARLFAELIEIVRKKYHGIL